MDDDRATTATCARSIGARAAVAYPVRPPATMAIPATASSTAIPRAAPVWPVCRRRTGRRVRTAPLQRQRALSGRGVRGGRRSSAPMRTAAPATHASRRRAAGSCRAPASAPSYVCSNAGCRPVPARRRRAASSGASSVREALVARVPGDVGTAATPSSWSARRSAAPGRRDRTIRPALPTECVDTVAVALGDAHSGHAPSRARCGEQAVDTARFVALARSLAAMAAPPPVAAGAHLLVAASGGPDSTALLLGLAALAPACGLAAHRRARRPRAPRTGGGRTAPRWRRSPGWASPASSARLPVTGIGLEARARHARLRALTTLAARTGASHVVLGHTADDQAETMLLRLLRAARPGRARRHARASRSLRAAAPRRDPGRRAALPHGT